MLTHVRTPRKPRITDQEGGRGYLLPFPSIIGRYAQGKCSRCGKILAEKRPVNLAVCDCFKYCPIDHGRGAYATLMRPQVVNNPSAPKTIIVCPICFHRNIPQPVEVPLPEEIDLIKIELPEKLYRKLKQVARRLKLSMDETTNLAMREGLDNID